MSSQFIKLSKIILFSINYNDCITRRRAAAHRPCALDKNKCGHLKFWISKAALLSLLMQMLYLVVVIAKNMRYYIRFLRRSISIPKSFTFLSLKSSHSFHKVSIFSVRRNKCRDRNNSCICKKISNFRNPSNIFISIFFGKSKVFVETVSNIIPI